MYANEASNRLFAAAFSVVISAAFFAYAIIPASPSLTA
ncbi:enoyl-CoA hydratase [Erythrobacter oryzae]|nr:enoyl-CoA hydratase [Erythrobacter sp. COR-2]